MLANLATINERLRSALQWKQLGLLLIADNLIAIGIFKAVFESAFHTSDLKYLLLSNTFLAIFFGAVVFSYFLLRNKLENAVARLAEKEINEQRLLRLKTKAELEALRAKVNPHFLFNTLNSIASLIPIDPAKAEEMVQKPALLFRYTLDASHHELMKLAGELRLIEEYLEIEKVRLGERLTCSIEADESLAEVYIPGLLLQPLVENSIKHGIAPVKTGGHISIKCSRNGRYCNIEITDTGKGFDEAEIVEGFGLSGVRERLALYFGDDYQFSIEANQGVRIVTQLPIKQNKDALQNHSH